MDNQRLLEELTNDEGMRFSLYTCTAGKLTIGVGRNLQDRGISRDEAMFMCLNDIKICESQLDAKYPWWRKLSDPRQVVLVNMCFNLGITTLAEFTNTLGFIKSGDYASAADNMLKSKWAKQVGKRAIRLANQMRTGTFQPIK